MNSLKPIALFVLLLAGLTLSAQDSTKKNPFERYTFQVEGSYNYQKCNGAELGFNILTWNYRTFNVMEFGPYFSCEYNLINSKNFFTPKFALGMNHQFYKACGYSVKLNIACYDLGKTNDYRLCPQVGLNIFGILNVYYGYNIPLSKKIVPEIGYHKLSVTFNFGYERSVINILDASGGM